MGLRRFTNGKKVATVGKKNAFGEYVVRLYVGGIRHEAADYHTTDRDDAEATAMQMVGLTSANRERKTVKDAPLFTGYDGKPYTIGDRVELHPGTDFWIRGARYGTVVGSSVTERDRVKVELDKVPGRKFSASERTFRKIPDSTNPRKRAKRARRLSLSSIARVHSRGTRKLMDKYKIRRPAYEALIKQEKARARRKLRKRNPSPAPRGLFYVQLKRGDVWKSYAACDTIDRAKVVAKALARAERAPVRVTDKPNEG